MFRGWQHAQRAHGCVPPAHTPCTWLPHPQPHLISNEEAMLTQISLGALPDRHGFHAASSLAPHDSARLMFRGRQHAQPVVHYCG